MFNFIREYLENRREKKFEKYCEKNNYSDCHLEVMTRMNEYDRLCKIYRDQYKKEKKGKFSY